MTDLEKAELRVERYTCEVAEKTYHLHRVKLQLKGAEADLKKAKKAK